MEHFNSPIDGALVSITISPRPSAEVYRYIAELCAMTDRGRDDALAQAVKQCIEFGRHGVNKPPEGHWLTEMWEYGRAIAAAPAEPVALTDEQIDAVQRAYMQGPNDPRRFARMILAAAEPAAQPASEPAPTEPAELKAAQAAAYDEGRRDERRYWADRAPIGSAPAAPQPASEPARDGERHIGKAEQAFEAGLDMALDPGIRAYVLALREGGVETFESCEGGEGHPFTEPTVRFHGPVSAGFKAYAVACERDLPVSALRLAYPVDDHKMLTGPWWEMTFVHNAALAASAQEAPARDGERLREAAQRCAIFFASVIKSGESWSPQCQQALDAALGSAQEAREP